MKNLFRTPAQSRRARPSAPLASLLRITLLRAVLIAWALFIPTPNSSAQILTPIFEFADTNNNTPTSASLQLSGDTLYGSTLGGTDNGGGKGSGALAGALFKLTTNGSGFTNFHIFTKVNSASLTNVDGANPQAPFAISGGKLYGVTENGGFYANGTVFALNADGSGFTNLYYFSANGALDGATPTSGLILSGDTLYGATYAGGSFGGGTIFAIHTDGSGFTNLYNFSAVADSTHTNTDGSGDKPGLILSGDRLFGTAARGGLANSGTIFSLNTDGSGFTNLHSFSALVRMTTPPYAYTNTDGLTPGGSLILSGDKLYGVATVGGPNTNGGTVEGSGTVFAINSDGSDFTVLHSFGASDGTFPQSLLLSGSTVYGTANTGGNLTQGVVFTMNADGSAFSLPEIFPARVYDSPSNSYTNLAGAIPVGNTVLAGNILYGVTQEGGLTGKGLIYALDFSATPAPIQFTATPSNGPISLTVQFNAPSNDAAGNSIVGWAWNFGDGSNSVSAVQNPSHIYTNVATFIPTLTCINAYGNAVVSSGPAITTVPPPPIQFTASPSNGVPAPVTVHFTSPSVDTANNPITIWNWKFGDGSTNATQNPSHTYSNSGSFFPTLACVNYKGDAISAIGPAIVVPSSLLLNGGFEAGSLANWNLAGYSNLTRVSTSPSFAHSGRYGVELDAPASKGARGSIGQTFATSLGASYLISFWLDSPSTITPNDFQVSWNGNVLLDETNLGNIGWTNIQLTVTASSTNSTLQFGYLTGLYFGLDDVLVTPITTSSPFDVATATLSGNDLVLSGTGGQTGHSCRLLMTTNLALPFSQWTPVATNLLSVDGAFTITATNALNPQTPLTFYSLQLQ